ncbi:hypothetical protein PIROE2DRAFT_28813, partial [Piromyces sp. E2]
TPLSVACDQGYENIVKYLVEQGADVNKSNGNDQMISLVSYSNFDEYVNIMNTSTKHSVNVNQIYSYNNSPLFAACENENENILKYLLEQGANVNESNKNDESPLIIACKKNNETLVKYLVDYGADVN